MSTRTFCDGCGKEIRDGGVRVTVSLGPITHQGDVCEKTQEECAAKHFETVRKFLADGGFRGSVVSAGRGDGPLST